MKHVLLSLRTIFRFKTYTGINVVGLALSLACVFILVRYIHQEMTVNHFVPELDRTFLTAEVKEDGSARLSSSGNPNKDVEFRNPLDDPSVERYSRFILLEEDFIETGSSRYNLNSLVVDTSFFQLIPYPCLEGTMRLAPNDALITHTFAKRIFGKESPIGKEFTTSTGKLVRVVGVVGQPSTKSSFQFDMVFSTELTDWSLVPYEVVRLYRPEDVVALNKKNAKPMKLSYTMDEEIFYRMYPLRELYLNQEVQIYVKTFLRGNTDVLKLLALVSGLILLVGLFNYVNLYTVVMQKRGKELGIKQIFGASKKQIFGQLYVENMCLNGIALLVVWLIVEVTRQVVATKYGIPVQSDSGFDWLLSGSVLFVLPFLTALYPFWKYTHAVPVRSLHSVFVGGKSLASRFVFLFFQYIITFCLVVAAIYLSRQLYFLLHTDVGYQAENVIQCRIWRENPSLYSMSIEEHDKEMAKAKSTCALIEKRLQESPVLTGFVYGEPPYQLSGPLHFKAENGEETDAFYLYTDKKYMELFGFRVTEGRTWNDGDELVQYKVIANRAFLHALHIKDWRTEKVTPNRRLWWNSFERLNTPQPHEIVGVMEDFRSGHLSGGNQPIVFVFNEGDPRDALYISFVPGKEKEAIAYLKQVYAEAIGSGEFEYSLVTDEIAKLHAEDRKVMLVIITFALIAVGISCLGLFGLSLYDIRQRYREIGLRKVHGAQVGDIYRLLIKKYVYVLLLAYLVGSIVAYLSIERYMETFVHRAPLSFWIFLVAGVLVALVALLTLYGQVRRASRINPADVIKRE
ncbi:FtsX-like permease family protein [Parabacteroides sp. AD58]|uniref:FtsX-like permease family protein n=1 Tax=Parabacteroides absconsus TaxID=2951805 RepID=A0ABZ2II10_9BACT|nr:ABC transporter permease [Parabacteroides sp. AD58]MCM6901169.1 ABC transporter permease [Parabacteroides sp. AD58]